ncbi:hypothetical protein KGQ34_02420 [Patescibacteria group bacterium]|nr:hypothetical protein [Patescibacteria group bacterium]
MNEPQNQTIDIQEELLKRYEALPQDLKEIMMSVETAEIIFEIGKKFGLNIEKTGKLAEEIGFVILGVVPSKDFVKNLKDILEVDEDKALGVASEANHRIFLKIRDTLKTMHGVRWVDQIAEKPIDTELQKPFAGAERKIKPAETVEKNKEQIPSILVEIKPTAGQPTTNNQQPTPTPAGSGQATKEPPQPILTEIKPAPEPKVPPQPPQLDVTHELEAPTAGKQQSATGGQVPEKLTTEQPPQKPTPTAPPQQNKYLVDPYREPFE